MQNSVEQRLLRSLFLLMGVTFFCWLPVPVLVNFLLPYIQVEPATQNVLLRIVQQLNKVAQAMNGAILFASR
jgi:hypothetical protein